jgi:hypothetical protein
MLAPTQRIGANYFRRRENPFKKLPSGAKKEEKGLSVGHLAAEGDDGVQRRAGALEPTVGKDSGRAAVDF